MDEKTLKKIMAAILAIGAVLINVIKQCKS